MARGKVSRTESDGRVRHRFVGRGRRGSIGRAASDDLDLRLAVSELLAARQQLASAHHLPVVDANGRIRRKEAIRTALAKLLLVTRLVDTVVMRGGLEPADCAA